MELNRLRRPSRKIYLLSLENSPRELELDNVFSGCRLLLAEHSFVWERRRGNAIQHFIPLCIEGTRDTFSAEKPYGEDELLGIVRRELFVWLESLSDWRKINNFCCISCCTPLCFTFWWLLLSAAFLGPTTSGREKKRREVARKFLHFNGMHDKNCG